MMDLSRKRSASPTQEELDQLTAMHLLKRQRLAAAQAAAEASFFRPSLMDMSGLYNAPLFHPGSARLHLANSFLAQQQPFPHYYSPMTGAPGSSMSPMSPAHPFAWRAAAMNGQEMPVLPSLPHPNNGRMDPPTEEDLNSPTSLAHPQQDTGLDQLSAFASHLPSMPVPGKLAGHRKKKKTPGDFCAPVDTSVDKLPHLRQLRTVATAKKILMPIPDNASKALHWEERPFVPLSCDEDANWLSEFQCFLRSEILEVFVASPRDLENRAVAGASKKKIATAQVGIRCRFCAHLHATERASRASAFPSSVRQIYQSFTMMLREHLSGQCEALPDDIKTHFLKLKGQSAQSASDSKRYWIYAAQKLGMVDTEETGIQMDPNGRQKAAATMKPFGSSPELEADLRVATSGGSNVLLCTETDKPVVADFTYKVVSHAVRVHLAASEKIGNRSCLTVGLPGLACRYCAKVGRSGLSRVFPARKRNLKTKVQDLYDHLRRCELSPQHVKDDLEASVATDSDRKSKVFYSRLWRRLGHENGEGMSPVMEPNRAGSVSPISSGI